MGEPRRIRKKYATPRHLWHRARLDEEKELKKEYGCKNMREIWRMRAILRKFRNQARKLIGITGKQAEREKDELIGKLHRLGLLEEGKDSLDDVLALTLKNLMERRLQTIVFRKGIARTLREARQLITHGHIYVNGRKVTSPNYLVLKEEENKIYRVS